MRLDYRPASVGEGVLSRSEYTNLYHLSMFQFCVSSWFFVYYLAAVRSAVFFCVEISSMPCFGKKPAGISC